MSRIVGKTEHTRTRRRVAIVAAFSLAVALPLAGCSAASPSSSSDSTSQEQAQTAQATQMAYEDKVFDTSYVHKVDITMSKADWKDLNAHAEEKTKYTATISIDGESFSDVTVATKGSMSLIKSASLKTGRYSLKVKFGKETGETYYGLDRLDLNANFSDASQMKDYMAYEMFRKMGVPAPLISYSWVTVNGKDYGLVITVEDMKDGYMQRNFSGAGQLYEGKSAETTEHNEASREAVEEGKELKSASSMMEMTAQLNPYTTGADLRYTGDDIANYPDIFDNAATDPTEEDEQRVVAALKTLSEGNAEGALDTDEVERYFAVQNFTCNYDSYTSSMAHNFYVYENCGKLSMLPWDYDYADSMCTNAFANKESRLTTTHEDCDIDAPLTVPDDSRPMWTWITANDTYLAQYHSYCRQLVSACVDSGWAASEISRISELISSYVKKDPTFTYSYKEYKAAVKDLGKFFELRGENVKEQLGEAM